MAFNIKNTDMITLGLFFTIISISGNYIGNTINCNTQDLFDNKYFKYIIMIIIINFTISYANKDNHPLYHLIHTMILFITFIIIQKLEYKFYIITWGLIFVSMIILQYKNYYETNEEKDKLETLKKIDMIVKILTLIMLLIGYSKYVVSYNYNNFDLFNFLFIKNKC